MTQHQLKAVWASARARGIDSETLHGIVQEMFGVDSLKKVDDLQAVYLLRRLNENNSPYSYLVKSSHVMKYASQKQVSKIKAMFDACGFGEMKRRSWILRAKSLKGEMNIADLSSNELLKKLKQKEAIALIASLVKVKKYLESKNR